MIPREMTRKGAHLLSYIDDFGGVAADQTKVVTQEALGSADSPWFAKGCQQTTPPFQVMVWLGLQFDTMAMTVTLPPDKLAEVQDLVHTWFLESTAKLHNLHTLLGKLFYVL